MAEGLGAAVSLKEKFNSILELNITVRDQIIISRILELQNKVLTDPNLDVNTKIAQSDILDKAIEIIKESK